MGVPASQLFFAAAVEIINFHNEIDQRWCAIPVFNPDSCRAIKGPCLSSLHILVSFSHCYVESMPVSLF